MNYPRTFLVLACAMLFGATAFGQDSLLGKKKGSSSNPPKTSSGGGSKDSNSNKGHRHKSDNSSNDSDDNDNDSDVAQSDSQNQRQRRSDEDRQRAKSRSGKVNYGTSNNLLNKVDASHQAQEFQQSHRQVDNKPTSIRIQIRREDRPQVHHHDNSHHDDDDNNVIVYRVGYYSYNNGFRDDYFCYPHYVFDPYKVDTCYLSPWYYYSFLPAYIDSNRLIYSPPYGASFFGDDYNYQPIRRFRDDDYDDDRNARYDNNYVRRGSLDYAIDDIVNIFMRDDRNAIDRLVPRSGGVVLGVDYSQMYAVRSDDFYDMLNDVALNSQTISYEIVGVRTSDDEASVLAKHRFRDSWGQVQEVYHRYHLFSERGHIVIRYFSTSSIAFW